MLVTALESGSETVPPLESVIEWLLREEQKMKDKKEQENPHSEGGPQKEAIYMSLPGHYKRDCRKFGQMQSMDKNGKHTITPTQKRSAAVPRCDANQPCTCGQVKE